MSYLLYQFGMQFFIILPCLIFLGIIYFAKSPRSMKKSTIIILDAVNMAACIICAMIYHDIIAGKYNLVILKAYCASWLVVASCTVTGTIYGLCLIGVYTILKREYMRIEDTDEYKAKKFEEIVNSAISVSDAVWYISDKDIPVGDIAIKATAKPAVVRFRENDRTYHFALKNRREYFVVRPGMQIQFINCTFKPY